MHFVRYISYAGEQWALAAGDILSLQWRRMMDRDGPKGPPSAPPAIPPIIINPYSYQTPAPAIDPRVPPAGPPVTPPHRPDLRFG